MNNFADQNFISSSLPTESPSSPRESVSRFKAGCIRIKMMYFNKDNARLLIALIGVILVSFQRQSFLWQMMSSISVYHVYPLFLPASLTIIFGLLSGILSYIYPPQNVLLISILSSSVLKLASLVLLDGFNIEMVSIAFICLLQNTVFATTLPAFHGIWASSFQLHKSSVLHVPIVLYSIFDLCNLDPLNIFGLARYFSPYGLLMVSLTWCAVWMYMNMNFKPNDDVSSSMKMSSANMHTLSTIPWKSMCTSIPVLLIMISYACETFNTINVSLLFLDDKNTFVIRIVVYVTMIFALIVLEFYPEIRFMSIINVRKFSTATYFCCQGVTFFGHGFLHDAFIYSTLNIAQALCTFGYIVNHMDMAPRYASVLCGFIISVRCCIAYLFFSIFSILRNNYLFFNLVMVLVNVTLVIIYSVFASAEIQPWAKTDEDGNQQEMEATATPGTV